MRPTPPSLAAAKPARWASGTDPGRRTVSPQANGGGDALTVGTSVGPGGVGEAVAGGAVPGGVVEGAEVGPAPQAATRSAVSAGTMTRRPGVCMAPGNAGGPRRSSAGRRTCRDRIGPRARIPADPCCASSAWPSAPSPTAHRVSSARERAHRRPAGRLPLRRVRRRSRLPLPGPRPSPPLLRREPGGAAGPGPPGRLLPLERVPRLPDVRGLGAPGGGASQGRIADPVAARSGGDAASVDGAQGRRCGRHLRRVPAWGARPTPVRGRLGGPAAVGARRCGHGWSCLPRPVARATRPTSARLPMPAGRRAGSSRQSRGPASTSPSWTVTPSRPPRISTRRRPRPRHPPPSWRDGPGSRLPLRRSGRSRSRGTRRASSPRRIATPTTATPTTATPTTATRRRAGGRSPSRAGSRSATRRCHRRRERGARQAPTSGTTLPPPPGRSRAASRPIRP